MWRAQSQKLDQRLLEEDCPRIVLDGPSGSGKSSTLLQLLDLQLQRHKKSPNKVLFYFPRISRWTAGYYPYMSDGGSPPAYVQPDLAMEILGTTALLNPILDLSSPISEIRSCPRRAFEIFSGAMDSLSNRKVLIFADDINALYCSTSYRDIASCPLSIDQLPVIRLVRTLIENTTSSFVAAVCRSDPLLIDSTLRVEDLSSTTECMSYLTAEETLPLLAYYKSLGRVAPKVDAEYAQRIQLVSGGSMSKILPAIDYDQVYQK